MIGVMDFGIGGLAVVEALLGRLPEEDLTYLAETSGAFCGSPRPEKVAVWAAESADRLERWGASVLVLAGHTLSCLTGGDAPWRRRLAVVDVAAVAVQKAAAVSRRQRIGLVGSRAVIESARHAELLRERSPAAAMVAAACPLWASLVAEGWAKRRETAMVVKRELRPLRLRQVDTLILGSSYFRPLRSLIQRKIGSRVVLVDPVEEAAAAVAAWVTGADIGERRSDRGRRVRLLVSELTPGVERAAQAVYGRPAALEAAD
jgi:glutamate racemase